ncbi:co-chaperone GroES [bacterium]|nr:co-chaperone GroES [bacterium]
MDTSHKKLIVMGDRVLIEPIEGEDRTKVGLYLPQTVTEKDDVQSGRIVATGPGTPMPGPREIDNEPWKTSSSTSNQHVPMQAVTGDLAIFLRKASVEIKYEGHTYLVVPQGAILVMLREQDLPRT